MLTTPKRGTNTAWSLTARDMDQPLLLTGSTLPPNILVVNTKSCAQEGVCFA
jgi:hypothetical protein